MCAVLEISKRTYYKYRDAEDKDYYDYLIIKEIFDESKGTYGYRRITEGLKIKYGVIFNHKKVQRIMNKYHMMPKYHKKLNKTKYKRIESNVMPNLIKRNFKALKPNQKWTTDITYLIYKDKRLYLSTILDLFDRKVVAYQISKFNDINILNATNYNIIQEEKEKKEKEPLNFYDVIARIGIWLAVLGLFLAFFNKKFAIVIFIIDVATLIFSFMNERKKQGTIISVLLVISIIIMVLVNILNLPF